MSDTSKHEFVPGYTGMSCDFMYIFDNGTEDGDPQQCGLPGHHPVHNTRSSSTSSTTISTEGPGMSATSEYICTHCGELAGYSPACIYCFDPIKYNNQIKEITMPQQADDINQLKIHDSVIAEIKEQETTRELIDGRVALYGDPVEGFHRIAQVWSGILGHEVTATDVCLCMMGMKAVRANVSPDYSDNIDDIAGYRDIYLQVMGEDMINARTGSEYWMEKKRRG